MPLTVPPRVDVYEETFVIEYQNKQEILKVAAPAALDAKDLFNYLWDKTGRT